LYKRIDEKPYLNRHKKKGPVNRLSRGGIEERKKGGKREDRSNWEQRKCIIPLQRNYKGGGKNEELGER